MTIQQPARAIEDGRAALHDTLFEQDGFKLRNIKCFVSSDLATADELAAAVNRMVVNRINGVAKISDVYAEDDSLGMNAAELLATL
ncbi:hypothetical protein JK203_11295 [Gluconobacter cerinus]|uniref:hypothetical protein n=1 Tax=Gluconobacter cerinus TaxID=38307 RepID=UPI001B8B96F4|nr:hypothetical protein [Gluconobacter cerinus]MBS1041422.1 hypothetical protein [Gluconobacter cerinus]MBS1048010.1 hypothetical protein [Gluconobacter cerinus]